MLRNEARLLLITGAVLSECSKDASAAVTWCPEVHGETCWVASVCFFFFAFLLFCLFTGRVVRRCDSQPRCVGVRLSLARLRGPISSSGCSARCRGCGRMRRVDGSHRFSSLSPRGSASPLLLCVFLNNGNNDSTGTCSDPCSTLRAIFVLLMHPISAKQT